MKKKELTDIQKKILEILKDYISKNYVPPTIKEICALSGLSSSSSVHHQLVCLEEKGYIARDKTKSRCIRILKKRSAKVNTESDSINKDSMECSKELTQSNDVNDNFFENIEETIVEEQLPSFDDIQVATESLEQIKHDESSDNEESIVEEVLPVFESIHDDGIITSENDLKEDHYEEIMVEEELPEIDITENKDSDDLINSVEPSIDENTVTESTNTDSDDLINSPEPSIDENEVAESTDTDSDDLITSVEPSIDENEVTESTNTDSDDLINSPEPSIDKNEVTESINTDSDEALLIEENVSPISLNNEIKEIDTIIAIPHVSFDSNMAISVLDTFYFSKNFLDISDGCMVTADVDMDEFGIYSGDLAIIEYNEDPSEGDIIFASAGRIPVLRLFKSKGRNIILSEGYDEDMSVDPDDFVPMGVLRMILKVKPSGSSSDSKKFSLIDFKADSYSVTGTYSISENLIGSSDAFLYQVKGDDMEGFSMMRGDIAIVENNPEPKNGEAVLALVNGRILLRLLSDDGGSRISFLSGDEEIAPVSVYREEAVFLGTVSGIIRKYGD